MSLSSMDDGMPSSLPLIEFVEGGPQSPFGSPLRYVGALGLLVALTVGDSVLVVVLFDVWNPTGTHDRLTLFINQGTAFVYIVWSLAALAVLAVQRRRVQVSTTTDGSGGGGDGSKDPRAPWYVLVAIGLMNGSGNFFMAISQPHTPGLSQTLLSMLGIPLVLGLAWVFLHRRPSVTAAAGAGLIVVGTGISGLRGVLDPDGSSPVVVYAWAIMLFGVAQIFLSGEKVYEEKVFSKYAHVQPMTMFCWTLCTQFTLGWALYPLQTVPALGGIELSGIPDVVRDGVLCTVGISTSTNACSSTHAALFWSYCGVDFWCYFCGLWVIQRGGASLMVLSSAIALPLQQLVLCARPIVGRWAEPFFWGDGVALVLVLIGFVINQAVSPEGRAALGINWNTRQRHVSV